MTLDNEILAAVCEQLNTISDLPCEVSLKELALDAPALFLHQTGGDKTNQTIAGSYDMDVQLELVYRTPTNSEKDVLTATALLDTLIGGQLESWTQNNTLPDLGSQREAYGYEVSGRSSVIATEENGMLIHALQFVFTYHQRSEW